MSLSVLVAAGGTGGHLVPALAVADAIRVARPDARIAFVGTERALDHSLVPAAGYRVMATSVRPFSRSARGVVAPLWLVPSTAQARRIIAGEAADVVLGMGGYASIPVVAAARMAKIPAVIHEANAVPGLANQLCARLTPHVAVGFAEARGAFGRRAARVVGVPLRRNIATLDRAAARAEAVAGFDLDPARKTVLVFGGSLGAARLNDAAIGLVRRWSERTDVQVVHAAGADHAAWVTAAVRDAAIPVRVKPYIERMDLAYAAADLVVSRAGASTVAELAATGTPSVTVPLPIARRREQDANARALGDGTVILDDRRCTAGNLGEIVEELLEDPDRLETMGKAAAAAGRPGAAEEIAAWVIELAERR